MSEQLTIMQAFAKAQAKLQAVPKNAVNQITKSRTAKYADINAIWEFIRPILSEFGLFVNQRFKPSADGVVTITQVGHESGEWMPESELFIPILKTQTTWDENERRFVEKPVQNLAQQVGSTITYARRYGLSAYLGIVTDEDDDAAGLTQQQPEQRQQVQSKTNATANQGEGASLTGKLIELAKTSPHYPALKAWWRKEKGEDLPKFNVLNQQAKEFCFKILTQGFQS